MTVTVSNIGNADLHINSISTPASPLFTLTYAAVPFPVTVPPNTSFTISATFGPTSAGTFNSSFNIATDAINGATQTVNLIGTGITPIVNVTPSPLAFAGSTAVGSTSSMNVSITNSGTADVIISRFMVPNAPFRITAPPTLPYTLTAGSTLSFVMDFAPTTAGTFSSQIGVLYDFSVTTVFYNVTGTGTAGGVAAGTVAFQLGATPVTTVDFGSVLPGMPNMLTLTAVNTSATTAVTINSATTSNSVFSTAFGLGTIPALSSTTFQTSFNPAALQPYAATLTLTDANGATYQLSLTGTGSPAEVIKTAGGGTLSYFAAFTSAQLPTATMPAGYTISMAADFTLDGPPSPISPAPTVKVIFQTLPVNPVFYTIDWSTGTWTQLIPTSITGTAVTFSVADNGVMDADATAGKIRVTVVAGSGGPAAVAGGAAAANVGGAGGNISNKGGGCFIATAAFGSYLDPHVMVLRKFRDEILLTNSLGRAFVAFYYRTSPPIADFIRQHESLRFVTRMALTPLIFAFEYPGVVFAGMLLAIMSLLANRKRRQALKI